MELSKIISSPVKIDQSYGRKIEANSNENGVSFAKVFQGYMKNIEATNQKASELTVKLATGELNNIHELTIATEQAKLALEMTVVTRDKAVEAYQEIMRMQF